MMTTEATCCLTLAIAELCQAKVLINREIQNYPTPVSGCDAQFNHLLSERARVDAALGALDDSYFVPTPRTPNAMAGVESR